VIQTGGTFGSESTRVDVRYLRADLPLEIAIKPKQRRRIDPRLLAPIAMLIAAVAIGLELAYTVGHYFNAAAQQIR
jgi:hypothetical protein